MKSVSIVHVTTVHPRFDTRIFLKECVSSQMAGFDVSLVVADGKGNTDVSGIKIYDVGKVNGRLKRMLLLPLRALSRVLAIKPDIVHFHDPELLLMGLALHWLGFMVIYDSHEDLPRAILSKHWINPKLRKLSSHFFEFLEDFCSKRLSAVVTATPHIAKRFESVQINTISVTNYPILTVEEAMLQRQPEPRTFVYIGAISRKRSAIEMIRATGLADARLIIAGPFEDDALKKELTELPEWKNVEYCGTVDHSRVWDLMSRSVAGLLLFYPEPNHINSVPNKLYEYMAGGVPIICSDFDDWRKIVSNNNLGMTCDPENIQSIGDAMRVIIDGPKVAEAMGSRGREIVMQNFRWDNEAAKLLELYKQLLTKKGH